MTFGDIFAKLSGVKLYTALKWYGNIIVYGAFGIIVLGLALLVGWFLLLIVSSIPWYGTLGIIVLLTGLWAAKATAPPDNLMDRLDQDILNGQMRKVRPINNWQEIRDLVASMTVDQGCNITMDGEVFRFENQKDALDFLDGKLAAQKS